MSVEGVWSGGPEPFPSHGRTRDLMVDGIPSFLCCGVVQLLAVSLVGGLRSRKWIVLVDIPSVHEMFSNMFLLSTGVL